MHRLAAPRTLPARLALGLLLGTLVAGCATTPGDPMPTPTPRPPLASPTKPLQEAPDPGPITLPTAASTPVPDDIVTRPEVQEAIRAEAERLGVDPSAVTVIDYRAVTWSDGSLGCPEPGKMYTQALVDGHQLILSVAGNPASYHAGNAGTFSYCPNPRAPLPPGSSGNA